MKIKIITIGTKMPTWIELGYNEYAKRFSGSCELMLHEIPMYKRSGKLNLKKAQDKESSSMLSVINKQDYNIALDINGKTWDSKELASIIERQKNEGKNISLLVGGPEGMMPCITDKADVKWSLSSLTFPHPLVRVILAEQIYRAWSILNKHPYHK